MQFPLNDPALKTSGRRVAFANWLTSRDNPLTARVIVNRLWHHLFGRGIVPTVDDFGPQGQPASHPELLDWLAADFVAGGWSLQETIRQIVGAVVLTATLAIWVFRPKPREPWTPRRANPRTKI